MQNDHSGRPAPAALDPRVDLPLPPVDGQSENMVFAGHDPDRGISFWSHLGRLAPDGSIWEGIFALYLSDGTVLSHRSIGRSVLVPATAEIRYEPLEPLATWTVRVDGVAQRVPMSAAGKRPVSLRHLPNAPSDPQDPYEPLRVDLTFTGTSPALDTNVSDQDWGTVHIHQLGRLEGVVEYAGRSERVCFAGVRDHTRGPRDYSTMAGEWWATCTFPSGRAFDLLQVWSTDGGVWSCGAVYEQGQPRSVSDLDRVPLEDSVGRPAEFEIHARDGSGGVDVVGRAMNGFAYTVIRPTGFLPGVTPIDSETLIVVEGAARFEWDGEVGYGWIERCRPVRELTLTDLPL